MKIAVCVKQVPDSETRINLAAHGVAYALALVVERATHDLLGE